MRRLLIEWLARALGRSHDAPLPFPGDAAAGIDAVLIEAVIAGLPDPVVALDGASRVVAFNAPAGLLAPALRRGEPASFALRMPDIVDAIRRATAAGGAQRVEFSERVPIDRWYEAHVVPVALPGSRQGRRPDLVMMTFHDQTPLRRVEEMRADFVANASHELRTPLATLTGFVETLQGPARDDAAARDRFLAIMKQQADRMARLIDDLLSLSRIELNAHRRPETPVDLVSVLRQVADALQTLARSREVEISLAAPSEPLVVLGDRDELVRVCENLVENALKYGAPGKRVDIRLAREAVSGGLAEAVVAVRDYGPGIAPEHLPRLTERFYRVDVGPEPRRGRHGARPRAGQAHPQPPSRPPGDRERCRGGGDLHGTSAAGYRHPGNRIELQAIATA